MEPNKTNMVSHTEETGLKHQIRVGNSNQEHQDFHQGLQVHMEGLEANNQVNGPEDHHPEHKVREVPCQEVQVDKVQEVLEALDQNNRGADHHFQISSKVQDFVDLNPKTNLRKDILNKQGISL